MSTAGRWELWRNEDRGILVRAQDRGPGRSFNPPAAYGLVLEFVAGPDLRLSGPGALVDAVKLRGEEHLEHCNGCHVLIPSQREVYRCTDCDAPFHRNCLARHCEDDLARERAKVEAMRKADCPNCAEVRDEAERLRALSAAGEAAEFWCMEHGKATRERDKWRARALTAESQLEVLEAQVDALESGPGCTG